MGNVVSIKDRIRAKTVGKTSDFKVTEIDYEGEKVAFRQPNLRERQQLLNKAKDGKGEFDYIKFSVYSVIYCTYVPDLSERVFDEADFDTMMESNTGGFIDVFGKQVAEILNTAESDDPKA